MLLFESGFENGLTGLGIEQRPNSSGARLDIVSSPVREGSKALRATLKKNAGARAEVKDGKLPPIGEYWVGISLAAGSRPPSNISINALQIVCYRNDRTYGDLFRIQVEKDNFRGHRSGRTANNSTTKWNLGSYQLDKYYDFVVYFKGRTDNSGQIVVYRLDNGESWTYNGKTVDENFKFIYMKTGAYIGDSRRPPHDLVIYTDAFRIGDENSSLDEVKPR